MSLQKLNITNSVYNQEKEKLELTDCLKRAVRVVRAMSGYGIPTVLEGHVNYSNLFKVMSGDIKMDKLADSILGSTKEIYDELSNYKNNYLTKIYEIKDKDYVTLFGLSKDKLFTKHRGLFNSLSREIDFNTWLKSRFNHIKLKEIYDYNIEEKNPKDYIIALFESIIKDIDLVCYNSEYSNDIVTASQKLIYVICLGGNNLYLPELFKFICDDLVLEKLNMDIELNEGFCILNCLLLENYKKCTILRALVRIEDDLNKIVYKENKKFVESIKIPNCMLVSDEHGITASIASDNSDLTLDDVIRKVCCNFDSLLSNNI